MLRLQNTGKAHGGVIRIQISNLGLHRRYLKTYSVLDAKILYLRTLLHLETRGQLRVIEQIELRNVCVTDGNYRNSLCSSLV